MILTLILALLFILLKSCKVVDWSWWWILMTPFVALLTIGLFAMVGCILAFGFKMFFIGVLLLSLAFFI